MIKKLAAFFERRRLHSKAESVALAAFETSSDEQAHVQTAHVTWSDDTRFIVQISYGLTRPPQRTWFSVTRDCQSATPMTYEQVNAVYRVPVWR